MKRHFLASAQSLSESGGGRRLWLSIAGGERAGTSGSRGGGFAWETCDRGDHRRTGRRMAGINGRTRSVSLIHQKPQGILAAAQRATQTTHYRRCLTRSAPRRPRSGHPFCCETTLCSGRIQSRFVPPVASRSATHSNAHAGPGLSSRPHRLEATCRCGGQHARCGRTQRSMRSRWERSGGSSAGPFCPAR